MVNHKLTGNFFIFSKIFIRATYILGNVILSVSFKESLGNMYEGSGSAELSLLFLLISSELLFVMVLLLLLLLLHCFGSKIT